MFRWAGFEVKLSFKDELCLAHKTGSAYFFDSQLFHRGGYETATDERIILSMEFSNPAKHEIAHGPIGTAPHLSFSFHKDLLGSSQFKALLDDDRVHDRGDHMLYAVA